jgi:hypothetical protein
MSYNYNENFSGQYEERAEELGSVKKHKTNKPKTSVDGVLGLFR